MFTTGAPNPNKRPALPFFDSTDPPTGVLHCGDSNHRRNQTQARILLSRSQSFAAPQFLKRDDVGHDRAGRGAVAATLAAGSHDTHPDTRFPPQPLWLGVTLEAAFSGS